MAYDIGPKIGMDGETEFRKQLQLVNTSLKTLGSEMKAVTSAFIGNESSVEALAAQNEVLTKTIDAQKDKIKQQNNFLDRARDLYGEDSEAALKWQRAVYESTAELKKLEAQLQSNNQKMEEFGKESKNSADDLENFDQKLRTLKSEMRLLNSELGEGEDAQNDFAKKTKILNEEIETQEKKIDYLQKELEDATKEFGEASTETLKWKQALNDANTELNQMKKELNNAEKGINDLEDSTEGSKISFEGLSEVMKAGFAAGAVGAVVTGAVEITGAIIDLVNETQEYRTIMASLEESSNAAGYSAEETAATFKQLYGVLGDTQTAATATANLQAIGLEQADLVDVTNAAIGAWAMYGDSIPIDGLAEAINETIKAGEVTGTFADVLNWAGTSEEDFNEKLAAANTETERANIVLQELTNQGLIQAGEAWRQNNEDIVAVNEAQAELDKSLGELGEALAPVASAVISFGADALSVVAGWINTVVTGLGDLIERLRNPELRDLLTRGINAGISGVGIGIDGTHALGLDYVPFDGYIAELHKGEMILTERQAQMMRSNRTADESLGNFASAVVNGMQTVANGSNSGPAYINLMTPEGDTLARWVLPSLINVANAAGTPIVSAK